MRLMRRGDGQSGYLLSIGGCTHEQQYAEHRRWGISGAGRCLLLLAAHIPACHSVFRGGELAQVTASPGQWLTTAFTLTMGVIIPVTDFLIQRFNTGPVFLAATSFFSWARWCRPWPPALECCSPAG